MKIVKIKGVVKIVLSLITYMKKLLDFDWLRAVQLVSNTSTKSVIPVQNTNQNSWIRSSVHRCKRLECFQKFRKSHSKFFSEGFWGLLSISEHFRKFPKIYIWSKMLEGCFKHFGTISEIFRRLPKISENFEKFWKLVGMFVFALSGAFS